MKEFYQVANKILRIKRNHPVVSRVKRDNETGEEEVFEDRSQEEQVIAEYFAEIYKRPDHMQDNLN
jgi:CO dehydrogenase/acetyl-CoA synthase beta subunit